MKKKEDITLEDIVRDYKNLEILNSIPIEKKKKKKDLYDRNFLEWCHTSFRSVDNFTRVCHDAHDSIANQRCKFSTVETSRCNFIILHYRVRLYIRL